MLLRRLPTDRADEIALYVQLAAHERGRRRVGIFPEKGIELPLRPGGDGEYRSTGFAEDRLAFDVFHGPGGGLQRILHNVRIPEHDSICNWFSNQLYARWRTQERHTGMLF
jgi:hypothetical protein